MQSILRPGQHLRMLLFIMLLHPTGQLLAQGWQVGPDIQQYPTGFLFGLTFVKESPTGFSFEGRLGYNLVRHGDAGVHEDERGGGWGATIGGHWHISAREQKDSHGWILGPRVDLWFNQINWEDQIGQPNLVMGRTNVIVLQPTAQLGYEFPLANHWKLVPTLALGIEINLRESGGEVGEGMIFLWGLRFIRRF